MNRPSFDERLAFDDWTRDRILAAIAVLIAFALLIVAGVFWRQSWSLWTLAWWVFLLTGIRASRPEFSAAALVPAMALQPEAGWAWVGLASAVSVGLGPRPAWNLGRDLEIESETVARSEEIERRLQTALPILIAVLLATWIWTWLIPDQSIALVVTACALASWGSYRLVELLLGRQGPLHRGDLMHAFWWLVGWGLGALLAAAASTSPYWIAVGLVAIWAIRQEANWHDSFAEAAIRRRSDVPEWVEDVYRSIAEATHCSWFELRMTGGGASDRWYAGPELELRPGPAQPPQRPPLKFGIHRRPVWIHETTQHEVAGSEVEVLVWLDPRESREMNLEQIGDTLTHQIAAAHFRSAAARMPGGRLVDRKHVLDLLGAAFSDARAQGVSVAVVLAGLDHAKEIQEVHGTEACESAVLAIAEVLDNLLGDRDAVCRYGGDEFLIVMVGEDGPAAMARSQNIRTEVALLQHGAEGDAIPLSVSAGVVAHPEVYVEQSSELIPLADAALFEARSGGVSGVLLALGRGRFQDSDGATIEGSSASDEIAAPRLFV